MRDIGGKLTEQEKKMSKSRLNETSRIEGRGKAFPPMILMAVAIMSIALTALASVVCVWDNSAGAYICSGEGSSVEVYGGGSASGLPPVVTNVVGVCTNCTDIAPDELRSKIEQCKSLSYDAMAALAYSEDLLTDAETMIDDRTSVLETYHSYPYPDNSTLLSAITNLVESSDPQTEQVQIVHELSLPSRTKNNPPAWKARQYWFALESTYILAQNELANLGSIKDSVENAHSSVNYADSRLREDLEPFLDEMLLDCRDCTYKTNGLSNGGTGGMGERWCTEEQGEAIISLLNELKDYGIRMQHYAQSTTNYLAHGVTAIRQQFLTQYNGIPIDTDWSKVYFDQEPTAWGYDPTNIMHRLEVLVYAIASSTNGLTAAQQAEIEQIEDQATELTEEHEDNADDLKAQMDGLMDNFETDADGRPVQSLGQALVGFFQAVGSLDGRPIDGGAEIFPSYPLKIGENEFYIPQLNLDEDTSQLNKYQAASKSVFSAIWYIMAAVSVFIYWRWFAGHAVKFTKWAYEMAKATMER